VFQLVVRGYMAASIISSTSYYILQSCLYEEAD
jgi:hypothetical protein